MRLSFKKSILLFTTAALGGMLGASAQDLVLEAYQDVYTFEQEWKNENVPTSSGVLFTDYRQGFGQNNQFYIQNKNASGKKIEIYDQNGYVGDFAESGLGSNITKDEAGNIIVRTGQYARPYTRDKNFRIIKADGSQSIDLTLPSDCSVPRGDYWGFANGDVFSSQGGKFAFSGSNQDNFYLVEIKSGQVVSGTKVTLPYLFGLNADMYFSSDGIVNSWKDAKGNQHYLAINSNENPIDIVLDENNNATATTIAMKSFTSYGTCTGANCFAFNGKNYIMFSTQPNWNDGFVIAELGTNADGTLDGTVNVVAQHVNDYTTPMGDNVSSKCDWLNWEPRDSKSIYVYQYFPGYYMARYIFGLKTDETPLVDIVNDGTVGETYTVADDILGVYIAQKEPTRVYAKDYGKHRYPSTIKDGETDFIKELAIEDAVLQDGDWDQSNWVLLDFGSNEEAQKYVGKVIKGGTLTGVLTNKLNPTMTVTESTVPTDEESYDENNYIGCNFMTPNVQSNIFWHGETYNFFFIEPKPQEYVKVHWARFNGGTDAGGHFDIVTDSDAKGSFYVDWSLYPGTWDEDFVVNHAYSFHAIVRYVEGTKAGAVEGNYMVFPLEGGDIVTGISNITSDAQVAGVTYVNMLGYESTTPFKGINLVVTHYTNGTTRVSKELR
ncbi:MAG: hypothetical protein IJG81_07880 [Muribaculaceae bacterium]|nr:hypothetical protein [Muribaculaceae bacterium]